MFVVKYVKRYLTGALVGLPVEDFYEAPTVDDARDFILQTEDMHLQFELSGGIEGWVEEQSGERFFYAGAIICAEGRA